MVVFKVSRRDTTPFDGQKPGTSGLRKKARFFSFRLTFLFFLLCLMTLIHNRQLHPFLLIDRLLDHFPWFDYWVFQFSMDSFLLFELSALKFELLDLIKKWELINLVFSNQVDLIGSCMPASDVEKCVWYGSWLDQDLDGNLLSHDNVAFWHNFCSGINS